MVGGKDMNNSIKIILICILVICLCVLTWLDFHYKKKLDTVVIDKTEEVKENPLTDLNNQIQDYIQEYDLDPSLLSYNIIDLETNESIGSDNKSENFTAGSVYKLPLSMIWYDKLERGEVSLYSSYSYDESDKEYGGGYIESRYDAGEPIPLYDILYGALVYSDNMSGHIMFNNLGGWYNFKVLAARYSDKEQDEEFYSLDNVLNAEYMSDVMKQIYDHQDTYATVIEYLRYASPDEFLNNTIQVNMVQKVGFYEDAMNACGLSLDGHPYIFCIFTQLGEQEGMVVEGDLNAICYEFFNADKEA